MTAEKKLAEPSQLNLTQSTSGLKKILVSAGWDFMPHGGDPLDVDLVCFVLGRDGMTRADEDFVFYNNPNGAGLAVKHLGDNRGGGAEPDAPGAENDNEAIIIDIDNIPFEVWRIVFAITIYQGLEKDQNFGVLQKARLRVENADTGEELVRLTLSSHKMEKATGIKLVELHREGVEWHYAVLKEPVEGGLAEIARSYGILISSTT